jgi:Tol biopolymer transport system component
MRNVLFKAAAAFVAVVIGVYITGCDGITGPPTEFGNTDLIYEFVSDDMYNIRLVDASLNGEMYILRTYNAETKERGLWYLETDNGDPKLIGENTSNWWGSPKLSPDKKNVVFEEGSGIYVIPVVGGEPRRIQVDGLDPEPMQWVDDETVLFIVAEWNNPEDYGWKVKTVDVYTLEVNTLLSVVIKSTGFAVSNAYLSPDDKYISVNGIYKEGDEFSRDIYFFRLYDTETSEYKEYVLGEDGLDYHPDGRWSPDGTKIGTAVTTAERTYLGYFDVPTSEQIMFFSSYKLLFEPVMYEVIWSDDGKKMLGSEDRDDNILRVFAIDVE